MVLAGCAEPPPEPSRPPAAVDTPPTEPAAPALPPRPADVPIDTLDPCDALTTRQLRELDVTDPVFTDDTDGRGARCRWDRADEPVEAYVIARVTTVGAESSLTNPRGAGIISIAGYPAVETQGETAPRNSNCIVIVDVAPGQALLVQYDFTGVSLPMTRPLACEKARAAAELAMETVLDEEET